MIDDDNEPITDSQRQSLNTFADELEKLALPLIKELREAETVGQGRRLLQRIDGMGAAITTA